MIVSLVSKIKQKRITRDVDIIIVIHSTFHKTICAYDVKLLERRNMYFIDVKYPKKRDAIVADYLANGKRIQQRNLNEKVQDLTRQDDLQKMFNPVMESAEKSTKAITEELAPMRE